VARLNAYDIVLGLAIGATAALGWEAYQTEQNDPTWCSPASGQCYRQSEMEDGYRAGAALARLNHSGVEELHTGPYTGPLPTDTTEGRDIIIP